MYSVDCGREKSEYENEMGTGYDDNNNECGEVRLLLESKQMWFLSRALHNASEEILVRYE